MADTTINDIPKPTQKETVWAAIYRAVRVVVAMGLPMFVSWAAGHPDAKWAGLAPVLMGIGKYLRDTFPNLNWIPV